MNKKFDAVGWMRKRRQEIDKEDEGLNWEEKMHKTINLLAEDTLWKRVRNQMTELASRIPTHTGENHP